MKCLGRYRNLVGIDRVEEALVEMMNRGKSVPGGHADSGEHAEQGSVQGCLYLLFQNPHL